MSAETDHILDVFRALLAGPTGDGQTKRNAGLKEHWTVDTTHIAAAERHRERWRNGEQIDPDSGCHPLVHSAWRDLATAYQELAARGDAPTVEVPGQTQLWRDVANELPMPRPDFINHDPRPLPRKMTPVDQTLDHFDVV